MRAAPDAQRQVRFLMGDPHVTHIRRLDRWRHGPAVLRLYAENFSADAPGLAAASPEPALGLDDGAGFVWVDDSETVRGAVAVMPNPERADTVIVANLATDARVRRRGIARALLGAVTREARRQQVRWLALQVDTQNAPACALYRALGFEQVGALKHYALGSTALPSVSITVRLATRTDAEAVWRLASAALPEMLEYAAARDLQAFKLTAHNQRRGQSDAAERVFVNAEGAVWGVVALRLELLRAGQQVLTLRPAFDERFKAAQATALLVGVCRQAALERSDLALAQVAAHCIVAQLACAQAGFQHERTMLYMRFALG